MRDFGTDINVGRRDFEADRILCNAVSDDDWPGPIITTAIVRGIAREIYVVGFYRCIDADFVSHAREGWPAALDEIARLERMLALAATEAAKCSCPFDAAGAAAVRDFCDETCGDNEQKVRECWIEYWRMLDKGETE